MAGKKLLIIGPSPDVADSPRTMEILSRWPNRQRPTFDAASFAQFNQDQALPDDVGVIWIIPDANSANDSAVTRLCRSLLEQCQERYIPSIVMADDPEQQVSFERIGAVTASSHDGAETICTALKALWSQVESLSALQMEIQVMHAHQGGLCGRMESLDEELRLAAQLQREFLPRELPHTDDIAFGALFRPAGYVSGDIYDAQRVDEKHIAFFIADAVGHGVPAALLTMYIKSALLTGRIDAAMAGAHTIIAPEEALKQLNVSMCRQQTDKVRFATACYGIIDCESREVRLARAGHPPPLLLRAQGQVETPQPDGPLLGVFEEAEFETLTFKMHDGDRLLLYTDGFEVAFDESEKQTYSDQLKKLAHGTLEEAVESLQKRLDQQTGSLHQEDDLTALLLAVGQTAKAQNQNEEDAHKPVISTHAPLNMDIS